MTPLMTRPLKCNSNITSDNNNNKLYYYCLNIMINSMANFSDNKIRGVTYSKKQKLL